MAEREVIFESTVHGRMVKVCAIDVTTGIEASILGDAHAGKAALEKLALQKLDYVMRKQKPS